MDEIGGILLNFLQSGVMPMLLLILRLLVLVLSMYVVWRCYTSFKKGQRRNDPVIMLVDHNAKVKYPILYWENSIGRSKSCDLVLSDEGVSRDHAVLYRREEGWFICDTGSKSGVYVNGRKIEDRKLLELGDEVTIGRNTLTLLNTDQAPVKKKKIFKGFSELPASPLKLMMVTSLVHLLIAVQLCFGTEPYSYAPLIPFGILTVASWGLYIISISIMRRVSFELETIGLLLSGIGILLLSGFYPEKLTTQFSSMFIGIGIFCFLIWFLEDLKRVEKFRYPVAIAALGVFIINVTLGNAIFGSRNWISIGGFSIQPSELIKIVFIVFGASTLDRLQTKKNITEFLIFAGMCLGFLFIMRDFGTALIYFACFLIIAFMRSGSIRTIALVLAAAVLGVLLIFNFAPHVASRFSNWGHVWDDPYGGGFQQTRMLTYFASGGLLGLGMGKGYLSQVIAAESDLTFGILGEEAGILMAFLAVVAIAMFSMYARSDVTRSRSTFYSICSCAAAGMLLFQTCLHVFGQADIIPFTGVTLPFISMGGSSMMSVWGLLALLKASDERTYAARRKSRRQIKEEENTGEFRVQRQKFV